MYNIKNCIVHYYKYSIYIVFILLGACGTKNLLPQEGVRLGVAPFMQPTTISELFAGTISEYRGFANKEEVENASLFLSMALKEETKFTIVNINMTKKADSLSNPLSKWLAVGVEYKLDFILIPQIIAWRCAQERRNTVLPALIIVDYYLIDVKKKALVNRSKYYDESNMLLEGLRYRKVANGIFYKKPAKLPIRLEDSVYKMLEDFKFIIDIQDKNLFYQ